MRRMRIVMIGAPDVMRIFQQIKRGGSEAPAP